MIFSPALFAVIRRPESSLFIVAGVTSLMKTYLAWLVTLDAGNGWGLLGLRFLILIGFGILAVRTFHPTVETIPISPGHHFSRLGSAGGPLVQLVLAQFVVLGRSIGRMAALSMDLIVLAFCLPAIAATAVHQTELAESLLFATGLVYVSFRGGLAAMLAAGDAGPLLIAIRRWPGLPVRYLAARGVVAAAGGLLWTGILLLTFVPFFGAGVPLRVGWAGPVSWVYFGLLMAGLEGIWHDARGAMTGWARLMAGLGFVVFATALSLALFLSDWIGVPVEMIFVPVGVFGLGGAAGVFLLGCGRMRRLES